MRFKAGGYAHAKQYKRLKRVLKRQRTDVGRLIRVVRGKMGAQTVVTRASNVTPIVVTNITNGTTTPKSMHDILRHRLTHTAMACRLIGSTKARLDERLLAISIAPRGLWIFQGLKQCRVQFVAIGVASGFLDALGKA